MSAGMIWYKSQPDAAIASALSNILFDFCGSIKSHDTTVRPQKIAPLIKEIFSRSDVVIIVGGQKELRSEENIVFILSRTLGIPLEEKSRSRSNYYYDTLRGVKLPSLAGSILFPSGLGGPEGILLSAGSQTIIVFPAERRPAEVIARSVHKFLSPRIAAKNIQRKSSVVLHEQVRDYEKFKRGNRQIQSSVTRTYNESEFRKTMENAVCEVRQRNGLIAESLLDDDNRGRSDENCFSRQNNEYYQKRSKIKKVKNIISLIFVIGIICSLIAAGSYSDVSIFASSVEKNPLQHNESNTANIESTKPTKLHSVQDVANIVTEATTAETSAITISSTKNTTTATAAKKKSVKKVTTATVAKKTSTQKTTKTTTVNNNNNLSPAKTMRIKTNGKVVWGNTVNILASIIEAEMGSSYNIEALKAQAVAAYTFYIYNGGSSKAPSFPTKTPGSRALTAATAVAGKQMKYNGKTPYTPYYAISAGKTASNSTINGTSISYLKSVDCSVDKDADGYKTVKVYSASKVADKVKAATGINLNNISDKSNWFKVTGRDSNNLYVKKVNLGGKTYNGSKLWLNILGSSYLRSDCYYISYDTDSDNFTFTSYGYGHGVGMSQKGANAYAAQGKDYQWILKHFYSGVTIL